MTGLLQRAAIGFATVGPFGFAPIAPGTAGSVAGLALFWAVRSMRSTWLEVAVLLVVTVAWRRRPPPRRDIAAGTPGWWSSTRWPAC